MGVTTYTHETTTPIAPIRLFKALVADSDNLIPKLMPQVKNIEAEGDGSIKKMNFVEGSPIKYLKHKIHVVDDKNLVTKYSMIEGDVLGDKLESISYDLKFEAHGNGGCVCKSISYDLKFEAHGNGGCVCKSITEYHTKGDYVLKDEEHNEGQKQGMELFKIVEAYLLANPSVYA